MYKRDLFRWFEEHFIAIFLTVLALLVMVIIIAEVRADKFYLRKDQWVCEKTETVTTMMPFVSGKTTMMLPQESEKCVLYRRIK